MKKWSVFLFLGVFVLVILPTIYADNEKLLCLSNGQVIEFSLCNSKIADRTCTSTGGCQYCVSEISEGVYCPALINVCNSLGLQCSYLDNSNNDPGTTIAINQSDSSLNNDSTNNTNTETNNDKGSDNSNSKIKTLTPISSSEVNINDSNNLDSSGNKITANAVKENGSGGFPIIFLSFTTLILIAILGFLYFKHSKKSGKGRKN